MQVSQNGFTANDRGLIAAFTIPRTQQKISLRKGDTSVILLDLLGWIHLYVEPLDVGIFDDWGYAERTIRGSATTLSNHASGTAADANATQHPLGVRHTWTDEERSLINGRLALYEGCVRWGDNYEGRVDGMHFEINRGGVDCKRIADRIRAGQLGGGSTTPSLTPAVPAATALEDDLMASIPITPDAGGKFHHAVGAEAGGGSAVASRGYVVFGSTYGGTTWTVAALGADGKVLGYWANERTQNNRCLAKALPDGTRAVTVEGTADNSGTRPWASTYSLR